MPLDAPLSITSDIQKLDAGAIIELFELDTTKYASKNKILPATQLVIGNSYTIKSLGTTNFTLAGASSNAVDTIFIATNYASGTGTVQDNTSIYRFHSDVNTLNANVVWQGNTYVPFPLEATGFESSGIGSPARPKLLLANISGIIGALTLSMNDLVGCKFTRRRTFVKYLDAVNFPEGINTSADPDSHFPDDIYYIDRKSKEDKIQVEFELASILELNGVVLPRRQVIAHLCSWRYKGSECGYSGTIYADEFDNLCSASEDKCGKHLVSCEIRFPNKEQTLPYGGFPAVGLIR